MPSFSIITPTICRTTLAHAQDCIQAQIGPYDEHIIVSDGPMANWVQVGRQTRIASTLPTGGYGAVQRDVGIGIAHGDYFVFLDDDNEILPGMLEVARQAVAEHPGATIMFRCEFHGYRNIPDGTILWETPQVRDGNVDTGMIVCPRLADMPQWAAVGARTYNVDYWFARAMAERTPFVWRTEVLTRMRPHAIATISLR